MTNARNSARPSHCGTVRLSTPRSPSPARVPLPVTTNTNRAPRALADRRKCSKASCAWLWVSPYKSRRPSIASLPRPTRFFRRRPSGASGAGLFSASDPIRIDLAEGGGDWAGPAFSAASSSFPAEASRNGIIVLVTVAHSTRSSGERARRRLPSRELITSLPRPRHRRRYCHGRFGRRTGRCRDPHFGSRLWKWGFPTSPAHCYVPRNEHHKLSVLLDSAGNVTDFLPVAKVDIGSRGADDRGAGVLCKQQAPKSGFGLFAFDWQLGLNPDGCAIHVDAFIDRQRALCGQWHALSTNAFVSWIQGSFLEEHEGAVLAPQRFAFFRIGFHKLADLVHRHFFFGDNAALDQEFSDRRIRHAVACDVVQSQELAAVELDAGGSLDLREESVNRTLDVTDFQFLPSQGTVFDLGAIEIGEHFVLPAPDRLGRSRIYRHCIFIAWEARAVYFGLVVPGEETFVLAARLDPHRFKIVFEESPRPVAIEFARCRCPLARLE